ncbi:BlaI/MecI/CopY family transcriptional regulator [Luteolibacter pohnpeiensis]|uniref:BlaI/MecI/CopY family transcriptional regulator n=1 Tax=Luteolibacter pohnpeiensis TaxID=454153 RepID=A0A934VR39_9BACT|nr:BlaI/MecI/CopY family transcriptional regulator [Luteolibacter pohnpeiensis]MBK1882771.1 BlaI/MecI/CopY family transcriptional regulator [Luteolibacter pohnpeiensis]
MPTDVVKKAGMSDRNLPALSPAEQALMDRIWKKQPVAASDLLGLVNADRDEPITRNTLQTQLSRLEAKGWIAREGGGRSIQYRALVSEKRGRGRILKELKQRMFGGSALSMMRCLVEDGGFSKNEISELRKLLEEKKGGEK